MIEQWYNSHITDCKPAMTIIAYFPHCLVATYQDTCNPSLIPRPNPPGGIRPGNEASAILHCTWCMQLTCIVNHFT